MGVNGHWYVEIEKEGFWRGAPHSWVNRYVMSGAQPAASDALSVIDQILGIEGHIMPSRAGGLGVGFVQGRAYPAGNGTFYANRDYNVARVPTASTGFVGPTWDSPNISWAPTLETCLLLETKLSTLSSTGKPVYLRKYYRGIMSGTVEDDQNGGVNPTDIAGIQALTLPFKTGMGTNNYVVIGNSGEQASTAPTVHPFLVAHQIPRGRRKKASSANILSIATDILRARGALGLAEDAAAAAA
jgi:hypothetical protein